VEEIAAQGWVPSSVLAMANYLADATGDGPPEVRDLLRRLITDEQMRGVWQDLQKHKRDGYSTILQKLRRRCPSCALEK
jgi:hypothetical protein